MDDDMKKLQAIADTLIKPVMEKIATLSLFRAEQDRVNFERKLKVDAALSILSMTPTPKSELFIAAQDTLLGLLKPVRP